MHSVKKPSLDSFLDFNLRHKWVGFAAAILIAAIGSVLGRDLPVRLSLLELLPAQRESVTDFKAVSKEFGGLGYLGVVIGPMDKPQAQVEATAALLRKMPDIRYVFFEREPYTLRKKALYLIPKSDFEGVLLNTETLVNEGKSGGAFDLGLGSSDEESARVDQAKTFFEKLRKSHLEGGSSLSSDAQRYFLSPDGRYAVVWTKPAFDSEDLERTKKFVGEVNQAVAQALPGVPFALWGRYVDQINDTDQIERDIALTSTVSLLGIAFLLVWGLGTLRGALLTVFCVTLSMGWTLGFAKYSVGQINIVTGFLLAILSGLGVEYGIHLIRRYYQERGEGIPHEQAVSDSYRHTGRALLSAALTSAGAFLVLSLSDFRAFSELGKIAGFGVLSIYAVYMLAFPAVASWLPPRQRLASSLEWIGFYPFSHRSRWLLVPMVLILAFGFQRAWFEYDFSKARKLSENTEKLNDIMSEIMPRSLMPAALLAETPEQALALKDWANDPTQDADAKAVLDTTLSIQSILPPDMGTRFEALGKFRRRITLIDESRIRELTGLDPLTVKDWVNERPYKLDDLPINLWDGLGQTGRLVLAYSKVSLSHADGIRAFNSFLMKAKERFPGVKIGSDVRIFTEILDHIVKDGRVIMMLFLVGAFFVLWLDFRSLREAASLELQLVTGIALLVALMGFFNVPFTIFNVAMIPAVLAAGIDMGVHVRHRELESGEEPIVCAKFVAQAVQLGALTTMIGFGSLFLAQANMLKGVAWISCLGQASMYLVCMFAWPTARSWLKRRKNRAAAAN